MAILQSIKAEPEDEAVVALEESFGKASVVRKTYQNFQVEFRFVNHGKTPAILKEFRAALLPYPSMGDLPGLYVEDIVVPAGSFLDQNGVSDSGDEDSWFVQKNHSLKVTKDTANAISSRDMTIWFTGQIVYVDIFGVEHTTTWQRRYVTLLRRFREFAEDRPYNQRT
jgi:hypothetical protein